MLVEPTHGMLYKGNFCASCSIRCKNVSLLKSILYFMQRVNVIYK